MNQQKQLIPADELWWLLTENNQKQFQNIKIESYQENFRSKIIFHYLLRIFNNTGNYVY